MKTFARLLLVGLLACLCLGSGQRKSSHVVSFHIQADPKTTQPSRMFQWPAGSGIFYEKSPVVHQKHITGFSPFDGDDGGWGAIFRLNTGGRNAMASTVATRPGKYLCALVQSSPRAITKLGYEYKDDGQIVIWEKLTPEDMKVFEKQFPQF